MKKILVILLTTISMISISQIKYPSISKDSLGNKVLTMTIEQAQKIDNNMEILSLLEKQGSQCDSLNKSYLKVIDVLSKQVSLLELDVNKLKEQLSDKDKQIKNLQERLKNEEISNKKCEEQKNLKDTEISILKEEVKRQKLQKIIGFIGGSSAIILTAVIILAIL